MNEKVSYQIVDSSPQALALCDQDQIKRGLRLDKMNNSKYPFREMLIGESFVVTFGELEVNTLQGLRSLSYQYNRKLTRKYRVFVHEQYSCVEVARLA